MRYGKEKSFYIDPRNVVGEKRQSMDLKVLAECTHDLEDHLGCPIREIAEILRPGGIFFAKSTFKGGGAHLKQNNVYWDIRNFNAVCAENGLQFVGQLKDNRISNWLGLLGMKYLTLGIRIDSRVKFGGHFLIYRKVS